MKINKVITGIDKSKSFRVYMGITTKLVQDAHEVHGTSPLATHGLGRALTGTGLMALMMKDPTSKLTVQFKGDGPAGEILCTAYGDGSVKGYISNPYVELPLTQDNKPDVGGSLGIGTLTVITDLGFKEPYMGRIDLATGEIADDLTAYYFISEQQPTSVALGVKLNKEDEVAAAGGMIIQMLPDAREEAINALEEWLKKMMPISELVEQACRDSVGKNVESIMNEFMSSAFSGIDPEYTVLPLNYLDINWKCQCSQELLEDVVLSLGSDEIKTIIDEDGEAELVCQFCQTKYHFDKEHLTQLLTASVESMVPKDFI